MQPVDEPMRLVQFPAQITGPRIHPSGAPGPGSPVTRVDDLELVRDVGDLIVECGQELPRLAHGRVLWIFTHMRILSSIRSVRAPGGG